MREGARRKNEGNNASGPEITEADFAAFLIENLERFPRKISVDEGEVLVGNQDMGFSIPGEFFDECGVVSEFTPVQGPDLGARKKRLEFFQAILIDFLPSEYPVRSAVTGLNRSNGERNLASGGEGF